MLSDFTIHWGFAGRNVIDIYYSIIFIAVFVEFAKSVTASGNTYLLQRQSHIPMTMFVIMMVIFLGFRPVNSGDMASYRGWYLYRQNPFLEISWSEEWLWKYFALACKNANFSEWIWFAFIAWGYIGCMFGACKKILSENVTLAMLFIFSSFTFFTYGTNTLRNGLACAIMMLAISFFLGKKYNWWIGGILLFAAFGIHRSTIIPITALFCALFVIKNPKYAIYVWLVSIVLSLVAGQSLMLLFERFNDERVEAYFTNTSHDALFSSRGFRWDFLLYSAIPVIITWFVCVKRKIIDHTFNVLSTTYMLANSVWVICIRASYSDRFAYLSWFLYPVILAYAFIRIPLFKNQDSIVSWVLLLYLAFTLFMFYVVFK